MEKETKEFELQISRRHARVLIKALDLYTRISIGQLDRILDELNMDSSHFYYSIDKDIAKSYLNRIKYLLLGLSPNESKGIASRDLHEDVHVAYEIEKVIQKIVAEVEEHHRYSVWHDGPLKLSNEPLPEIKLKIYVPYENRILKGIHPSDRVRTKCYLRRVNNP